MIDRHGLGGGIRVEGEGWWPRLSVGGESGDAGVVRSLLRQEFLAEGLYLLSSMNLSLAHDHEVVMRDTLTAMDAALGRVAEALRDADPAAHLKGTPVQEAVAAG